MAGPIAFALLPQQLPTPSVFRHDCGRLRFQLGFLHGTTGVKGRMVAHLAAAALVTEPGSNARRSCPLAEDTSVLSAIGDIAVET